MAEQDLLDKADRALKDEKLLEAARYLRQLPVDKLSTEQQHLLTRATALETALDSSLSFAPSTDEWTKQGESHASCDFDVYYKVDKQYNLTCRIDLIVESSLMLPILAIFNESDLYQTWMPRFTFPVEAGVRESIKLKEMSRGQQIIQVTVDMPFPLATREAIQETCAVDAIDEHSAVLIRVATTDGEQDSDIPLPEKGVVRIDLLANMVMRHCPDDHALLTQSKRQYPADEPKILLTIEQQIDPKINFAPTTLVNFFTRIVIKQMVLNLVRVATEVRSGERPQHKEAIEKKQELYGWIEERLKVMCSK